MKVDNLLLLVVQILPAVNLLPRLSQGCDHLVTWLLQGGQTIGSRYKAMAGIFHSLFLFAFTADIKKSIQLA